MLRIIVLSLALTGAAAAAAEQGASRVAVDPRTGRPIAELPVAPPAIEAPLPDYPLSAFASGLEGFARLAFTVAVDGHVQDVAIVEESHWQQGFGPSAAAALEEWRYPTGVAGRYRVKVNFKMPPGQPLASTVPPPLAPRPISRKPPKYPGRAERANISGFAVVDLRIAFDGSVKEISIFAESPPGFDFGAMTIQTSGQWTYPVAQPGRYRGYIRYRLN